VIAEVGETVSVGVDPKLMGFGPVPAIRGLLAKIGKQLSDIDLVEINEAFAAQVMACAKELNLPADKCARSSHLSLLNGVNEVFTALMLGSTSGVALSPSAILSVPRVSASPTPWRVSLRRLVRRTALPAPVLAAVRASPSTSPRCESLVIHHAISCLSDCR